MGSGARQEVTHAGRSFASTDIELITGTVRRFTKLSRTELAATVCELLNWRRGNGALKTRECRDLLHALEARGVLSLPAPQVGRPRGSRTGVPCTAAGEMRTVLRATLREIAPVRLELVEGAPAHALWREFVGRYHYLGHATPFGAQLRYLVRSDRAGTPVLGCLQYSSAAWRLAARDRWIGWNDRQRQQNLTAVVQQSRFLLLPWIHVAHLASHVLALSARGVASDWMARYARRPLLVETLVDASRYAGTCYRAANWIEVGVTAGRGRLDREHRRHAAAPKRVFVYPLDRRARVLLAGQRQ
jgi:hypothetical protein